MEAPRVIKFGGSSLQTPDHIKRMAQIIADYRSPQVVVVSAMGDTTDDLLGMAGQVSKKPSPRELDMLVSAGERISMALMGMALEDLGRPALSLTGSQVGIVTTDDHTGAKILEVKGDRVEEGLRSGAVVIVAGFQGVSRRKEITTLGRGGSDLTAVALGVRLKAQEVLFYKDVPGVFPYLGAKACLSQIHYRTLHAVALAGNPVLQRRSLELAFRHGLRLKICSGESAQVGTEIKEHFVEEPILSILQIDYPVSLTIKSRSALKDDDIFWGSVNGEEAQVILRGQGDLSWVVLGGNMIVPSMIEKVFKTLGVKPESFYQDAYQLSFLVRGKVLPELEARLKSLLP